MTGVRHLRWFGESDDGRCLVLTYCGLWLDQHGDINADVLGTGPACRACTTEVERRGRLARLAVDGDRAAKAEWKRTVCVPPKPRAVR